VKKRTKRIRYLNWVQGRVPPLAGEVDFVPVRNGSIRIYEMEIEDGEALKKELQLEKEVHQALNRLNLLERKFIQYFYFECLSYEKIAELLNKKRYKLQRIHRRSLNKLKIILKDFVQERFTPQAVSVQRRDKNFCDSEKPASVNHASARLDRNCILCHCRFKEEINLLIQNKTKDQTWKPLMKLLKEKYNLKINTPQVLIGHQKNHMV
jgi:hypothetical protein